MSRTRVMVTGTGPLGVGEGLVKCLQAFPDRYEVWAANMDDQAASLYESDQGLVLPPANHPTYLAAVTEAVERGRVEFLLPGSEHELNVLTHHIDRFQSLGCRCLANQPRVVEIGNDKFATFEFLSESGIPTPFTSLELTVESAHQIGYPLVLKPRSGGGGRNVFVINSDEELSNAVQFCCAKGLEMILQEHIGEARFEFTASALCMPSGDLIGTFAARRTLLGGATGTVEVEDFPEIRAIAAKVAGSLAATGPINVQCRLTPEGPSVFEINPRFSGSAPFRALAGFNEPDLMIRSILHGEPMELPPIRLGTFGIRSFGESLFDKSAQDRLIRLN